MVSRVNHQRAGWLKVFIGILAWFSFVLFLLAVSPAYAIDLPLNGTRTILVGTDCNTATYRFGTTATFNGKALDLLVEVLAEDNDLTVSCIKASGDLLTVDISDGNSPDGDLLAFMDLKITVVEKNTTTPVLVDRITLTSLDLDSNPPSTSTDDVYFKLPD